MNPLGFVLGLAPWFLFSVLSHRLGDDSVAIAALIAAALAAVMAWTSRGRGGVKFLDIAGVVTFGAIAVAGFLGGDSLGEWLTNFARGGSTLILAVLMLISAVTVPFTEQYAKDSVPEDRWSNPLFRATNRKVSAVWGFAVLVMGLGHVVAGLVDPTTSPSDGTRPMDLLLNWIVPIALLVLAGKYTKRAVAAARQERDHDQGVGTTIET